MNKILINTPDLRNKGGVAQYYKVLQLDKEPNIDYFNINNIGNNTGTRLIKTYAAFLRAIQPYDLVVLNPSLNSKSFLRDAVFTFLATKKNKKVIVFWHGWNDLYEAKIHGTSWLKTFFKYTYAKADAFVVFGDIFKKKLINLGAPQNVFFFKETMSISDDWLTTFHIEDKHIPAQSEAINILFLSRIVKEKGVYTCVDVAGLIAERHPTRQITMHIAGDGEELDNLKKYAADRKVKNVIFHGDVRGETKFNLLGAANLFLFPTEYGEGFPNVILEALFFGLPLITRPVAAIPDVVKHGVNGYLEAGTAPEQFLKHIEEYLQLTVEQRREIATICHTTTVEKYNLKHVRSKILNFYNNFEKAPVGEAMLLSQ